MTGGYVGIKPGSKPHWELWFSAIWPKRFMPITAVVNASDQGHQSDLPVRMGMYVGEEGVDGSFNVGNGKGKRYR